VDGGTTLTTGRSWMPQGENLVNLSANINKQLKKISKIERDKMSRTLEPERWNTKLFETPGNTMYTE